MSEKYEILTKNIPHIKSSSIFYSKFTNNGSDNLAIDGSTEKEFIIEGIGDKSFLLRKMTFLLGTDSLTDLDKFGDLPALTNGAALVINEGTTEEKNLVNKTNGDIILSSSDIKLETVSFAATEKSTLYGERDFVDIFGNAPVIMNNKIKIVVRDDLSTLKYFKASLHGIFLD